jgi:hypothetical protein
LLRDGAADVCLLRVSYLTLSLEVLDMHVSHHVYLNNISSVEINLVAGIEYAG